MRRLFENSLLRFNVAGMERSAENGRAFRPTCLGRIVRRGALLMIGSALVSWGANAQSGSPAPRPEEQPSLMKVPAEHGEPHIQNHTHTAHPPLNYLSTPNPLS